MLNLKNGRTIYKGIAEGTILICNKKIKQSDLSQNTILVVSHLDCHIVPFIKGVRGIIAEKGGITSHPATVCREFNIPSILGISLKDIKAKNDDVVILDTVNKTVKIHNG